MYNTWAEISYARDRNHFQNFYLFLKFFIRKKRKYLTITPTTIIITILIIILILLTITVTWKWGGCCAAAPTTNSIATVTTVQLLLRPVVLIVSRIERAAVSKSQIKIPSATIYNNILLKREKKKKYITLQNIRRIVDNSCVL